MEPDRYQENPTYYIVGLLCLVASMSLFAFSAYIVPYLLLDWHYSIPDFIPDWVVAIQSLYNVSISAASWLVFSIFFIPAIIMAIVADIASNRIDNKIYGINTTNKRVKSKNTDNKESTSLILRIVFIIILVFIASQLFHWAISTRP